MKFKSLAAAALLLLSNLKRSEPSDLPESHICPRPCGNRYGDFTWQMTRKKGHPVAVIHRKGDVYRLLRLHYCRSHQEIQTAVTDYLQNVLLRETDRRISSLKNEREPDAA